MSYHRNNGVNAKLGHNVLEFCSCDNCWNDRVQAALKRLNPKEANEYLPAHGPVATTSARGR